MRFSASTPVRRARAVAAAGLALAALGPLAALTGCLEAREGRQRGGAAAGDDGHRGGTLGWTSGRFVLDDLAPRAPLAPAATPSGGSPAAAPDPALGGPAALGAGGLDDRSEPNDLGAPADASEPNDPTDPPDPADRDGDRLPDAADPCVGFANAARATPLVGTAVDDLCGTCRELVPRPLAAPARASLGATVVARFADADGTARGWVASADGAALAVVDAVPGVGLVRALETPGLVTLGLVRALGDGRCEVGEAEVEVVPDAPLAIAARATDGAGRPLAGAATLHVRPVESRPDGPSDCRSPLRCDGGRGPESVRWGDVAPAQREVGAVVLAETDPISDPLAVAVDLGDVPGGRATVVVDVWVDGALRGELRRDLAAETRWRVGVLDGGAIAPDGVIESRARCP